MSSPRGTTARDPSFTTHRRWDPHITPYRPAPTHPHSIAAAPFPLPSPPHPNLSPSPCRLLEHRSRNPAPLTATRDHRDRISTTHQHPGGPTVGKEPCPIPAAPGCTSCTAGGKRTPAAPAAPSGRAAAPGTRRWVPAAPRLAPSASRCPVAGLSRFVGDAWQRDLSGEGSARPRGAPGERWKLLHSLRFKSRHNDAHVGKGGGGEAPPGVAFVRTRPLSFLLPEPRRAPKERRSQARARR